MSDVQTPQRPPVVPVATASPAPAVEQANPTRKRIALALAAVVFLVALFFGFQRWTYGRGHETSDNAQIEGDILPVLPRVSGYVERVAVEENQPVKAGDTRVVIDSRDLDVKLRQAEADLAAAEAAGSGGAATAGLHAAQAQQAAAGSNIAAAQAAYDRARADVGRFRELAARDVASRSQLDAAEAGYRSAQAALSAAKEGAQGSGAGVAGANAQIKLADAKIAAQKAAVETARLQLSYTVLTAPAAGRISRKTVEPGQLVNAGQPLLSIVSNTEPWVTANLKETQLDRVHVGQSVEVDVDAYPGQPLHGTVESIGGATGARFALLPPDNASGNFTKVVQRIPVRISLDPTDAARRDLRPGMSVNVAIDVQQPAKGR